MIVVNWSTSQSQMQMKFKRISVERSKYLSICEILNHNIHSFNFRYELYCAEILLAGVMKQVIKRELLDLRPFKNYLIEKEFPVMNHKVFPLLQIRQFIMLVSVLTMIKIKLEIVFSFTGDWYMTIARYIQNLFLMKVEPNCPPSHSSATDIKITVDQWMNNTIEKQDTTDSSQDTNK